MIGLAKTHLQIRLNGRNLATMILAFSILFGSGTVVANAGSYNRGQAVAYADQWAHGRNPAYVDLSPNDCTNFISQAMNAGGLPQIGGGNKDDWAWWYSQTPTRGWSNSWSSAPDLNQHASNYQGTRFTYSTPGNQGSGDFLLMSLNGTGLPSHGRVIVGWGSSQEQVDPNTSPPLGTWGLLADQHTTDRKRVIWNDGIPPGTPLWAWVVSW